MLLQLSEILLCVHPVFWDSPLGGPARWTGVDGNLGKDETNVCGGMHCRFENVECDLIAASPVLRKVSVPAKGVQISSSAFLLEWLDSKG